MVTHPSYDNPHFVNTLRPDYFDPVCLELSRGAGRHLTIGCFLGMLESEAIQRHGWAPDAIALLDIDCEHHTLHRDALAYAYQNICSRQYANYSGEFVLCRADSQRHDKLRLLDGFGPFAQFYVDGLHTAEGIYNDLTLCRNLADPRGARILVHDIHAPELPVDVGYRKWIDQHSDDISDVTDRADVWFGLGIITLKPSA